VNRVLLSCVKPAPNLPTNRKRLRHRHLGHAFEAAYQLGVAKPGSRKGRVQDANTVAGTDARQLINNERRDGIVRLPLARLTFKDVAEKAFHNGL
jgi:hypothetical protein